MEKQIQFFLEKTFRPVDNTFVLWNAMNAYLRGHIGIYTSKVKKEFMAEMDKLEKEFTKLEKESK